MYTRSDCSVRVLLSQWRTYVCVEQCIIIMQYISTLSIFNRQIPLMYIRWSGPSFCCATRQAFCFVISHQLRLICFHVIQQCDRNKRNGLRSISRHFVQGPERYCLLFILQHIQSSIRPLPLTLPQRSDEFFRIASHWSLKEQQ